MGRKRGSMASDSARDMPKANKKDKRVIGEGDEPQSQELCPFANLPSSIITNHIMLRLPIKTLVICKLVCKTWNALISDPYFTRLHLQCATPSVMIRTKDYHPLSRTMYLFELDKFERDPNYCVKLLGPASKLPLHDNVKLSRVVNSCNGFLCLQGACKKKLVICNPVTGEFIKLPKVIGTENTLGRVYDVGFGFQPKTNEYKVVRIWETCVKHERSLVVQIHTLGKSGWRNVDVDNEFLTKINRLTFPTCVNGAIHWINLGKQKGSILCFDFESEKFQSLPFPSHRSTFKGVCMVELEGFLYVSETVLNSCVMWVMKNYGVGGSWTKVLSFKFDKPNLQFYNFWPVKHVEKGVAILMTRNNYFAYYEPGKNGSKLSPVIGTRSTFFESGYFKFKVTPHIPSLVSLKDVVMGDNIKVLNVHSRPLKFKLKGEDEVILLTRVS